MYFITKSREMSRRSVTSLGIVIKKQEMCYCRERKSLSLGEIE